MAPGLYRSINQGQYQGSWSCAWFSSWFGEEANIIGEYFQLQQVLGWALMANGQSHDLLTILAKVPLFTSLIMHDAEIFIFCVIVYLCPSLKATVVLRSQQQSADDIFGR